VRIQILLYNGFDELDALGPLEVLRNAAARSRPAGHDLQVELVTLDGAGEVVGAHGLRVRPEARLAADGSPGLPDLLLVPGGGWNNHAPQGAWAEVQCGEVPRAIASLHAAGVAVASVCTGAMLVAAAGLVKGRPAITHRSAAEQLRAAGAEIIDARVVDDGDLLTAGGVTSGLDLALWLVQRHFGAPMALAIEREMEYELRGPVWRRQDRSSVHAAGSSPTR
jgi:transcriptional regulator GlxA family with amidase domain